MDLSTLSKLAMLSIFQRMEYSVLARVRKTSKSIDAFIEKRRHSFRQYCSLECLHIRFTSLEQPLDWENQTGYFHVSIGETMIEIKDPYRELSPFLIRMISIWHPNAETPSKHLSPTAVFPVLRKLKPKMERILFDNLSSVEILAVADIVQSEKLIMCITNKSRLSGISMETIMQHKTVQKRKYIVFDGCSNEQDICSLNLINRFILFRSLLLIQIYPIFINSMIEHLRVMPNLGKLEMLEIKVSGRFFNTAKSYVPQNHLLASSIYCTASIHLIEGVNNWIVCWEQGPDNERTILLTVLEKDPLELLLDLAVVLGEEADISPIREKFINASDMEERHKIFQLFYLLKCAEIIVRQER